MKTVNQAELETARRAFEARLQATRERIAGELGMEPRRPVWLLLLLAGAVGVATAVALKTAKTGGGGELPPAAG